MSRLVLWILLLVLVVGGALWLASLDTTRPTERVEKIVADNALAR